MNRSKKQVRRQSRRSQSLRKQQSKRRSQQIRRQSLRKQSKSRQSRKQLNRRSRRSQRGGNYFFDVASSRIGGLAEVARVDDPIAPIAGASKTTFPTPLYQQPAQQTVTVPSSVTGAEYNGNGMTSVFHDTMTQRDFSCKGPQWAPSCI